MNVAIELPNYTQFPNVLLDHWMPIMPPHEFCVLAFMVRKIFGFHKREDRISISQIAKGTGQTTRGIINHIKNLIKRGLILRFKGKTNKGEDETNLFTINIKKDEEESECHSEKGVNGIHTSSECHSEKGVNGIHTQKKTFTKETTTKERRASAPDVVFSCLKDIEMTQANKERLCRLYTEDIVKDAIAFATSPQTQIKTTLAQTITWACQERLKPPIDKAIVEENNRKIAKNIERQIHSNISYFEVKAKGIEIGFKTGCVIPIFIDFSSNKFSEEMNKSLERFGLNKEKLCSP